MAEKEKKQKSKLRKALEWVITAIFIILFLGVASIQIVSKTSAKENYGVPKFKDYQVLVVLTDSMEPEYEVKTALFVKQVKPEELNEGDDITFYYPSWSNIMANPVVTHRIEKIEIDETKAIGYGHFTFVCHGINTDSENCHQTDGSRDCTKAQYQRVNEQYVLGKVVGQSEFVGHVYSFITTIWGLLLILLIPALYLIVASVIDLCKALKEPEEVAGDVVSTQKPEEVNDNNNSSLDGLSDEDKERLKKELLNELIGGKDNEKE